MAPALSRRGRVHLATRTLLYDRLRLAISLAGIGFAVFLLLLLRGIMDGTIARSTTYVDHVGADLFVAGPGVTNMLLATSAVPAGAAGAMATADGVSEAAAIMRFPVIITSGERSRPATAIGYGAGELGGPWRLTAGRPTTGPGETVLDAALADELGAGVGDTVSVGGRSFTISGLSDETAAIAGKVVFLDRAVLQSLAGAEDTVNFVLVRVAPGAPTTAVAADLRARFPGLSVLTREDLSRSDRGMLSDLFISPINVMSTAGFLVGLAIVGLTMYTTTAERLRDFGVLKAIGASDGYLLRIVVTEAVVLGAVGFVLGYGVARLSGPLISAAVPDIGVTVTAVNAARGFLAMMAMCLVAAAVPVARAMRVDPLLVFRRA